MDQIMKREILLDNYNNPTGRGLLDDDSYIKVNTNNESCIDNLDIGFKIEHGVITDIRFDGEACAISTSATSIMIKMLVGKTLEEAQVIIDNYHNMLEEKEYDKDLLKELVVYDEIYKQPNRKRCAYLPFESFEKVKNELK